jgi:hypothetical protein
MGSASKESVALLSRIPAFTVSAPVRASRATQRFHPLAGLTGCVLDAIASDII